MAWTYGGKPNPQDPILQPEGINPQISEMPELQRVPGQQIKVFREVLKEEYMQAEAPKKEAFR